MCCNHSPLLGEHPSAKQDQNQRPETIDTEFPDVHGVEQKEHAQSNQDDRNHRDIFGFALLTQAECLRQSEWIRWGLAFLKRAGGSHCVNDLIDVEKSDGNAEQRVPASGVIGREYEQSKNQQVSQSLGVLRAINRAHSERKKSGQDACNRGVRARAGRPWWNRRSRRGVDGLRIDGLWRHESGSRDSAIQTGCEARLAVDDSANVAGASAAKRFAASAAKSYCRSIAVNGAVHTNLLYVVTDTTGRSGFNGSKTVGAS